MNQSQYSNNYPDYQIWDDASEQGERLTTCKQCGSTDDLMVPFTKDQVCGKCTRSNHKRAVK